LFEVCDGAHTYLHNQVSADKVSIAGFTTQFVRPAAQNLF